ncbi:LCP family glycopolymer transferase [Thalassobacillus hwangdonensis]|uniref:LCP family protein n=1 Tax=Thalassobacillus hwangdonensis TaxID=546108 RepID=A0ABW3L453_9BACI
MATRREMKQTKKKRKGWKIVLIVLALLLIGGGAYAFSIYNNVKQTVDKKLHAPISSIDTALTEKKVKAKEPLNILLLGVDERSYDKGRSDTMIVMTLDPKQDRMQMVSIPRDTRTTIVGKGFEDKINHSYAFGGSEMAVDTVENFLDIELDYYVRMNMEGLEQLVDAVGGVTVNNGRAFDQGSYHFEKGQQELNGREALAYVRMRKQDPQGDAGRNERQRQVIQGILEKGASFNGVGKINDILDVLGNNMSTNMKFEDMRKLATDYRGTRKSMETYQMTGSGQFIGDIWYLIVPDSEVQKTQNMIKEYSSAE